MVMRTGELTITLISCSTEESRHCISSGQHNRLGFSDRGTGDMVLPEGGSMGEPDVPLVCHVVTSERERDAPHPLNFAN